MILASPFSAIEPSIFNRRDLRSIWSAEPNTTDPIAPFGIVTLHPNGGFPGGSRDYGGLRWSQTANFGSLPNEAMPNSFLAQTYDLHDPWHVDV